MLYFSITERSIKHILKTFISEERDFIVQLFLTAISVVMMTV